MLTVIEALAGGTVRNVSAPAIGVGLTWKTCSTADCPAAGVASGACVAHLDEPELSAYLEGFSRGRSLDARGAVVGPQLLERVLHAAPVDSSGRTQLAAVRFDEAILRDVRFDDVTFRRDVSFDGADLSGSVSFRGAEFQGSARFAGTRFGGHPDFGAAVFSADAWFAAASFTGDVSFEGATFAGPVRFSEAAFAADASFAGATFGNDTAFEATSFGAIADFSGATFEIDAGFDRATFGGEPRFDGARFKGSHALPEVAPRASVAWSGPPLATWSSRAAASLIDHAIPLGILLVTGLADLALLQIQPAARVPFYLRAGGLAAVLFLGANLAQQGRTGQSLGKRTLGLRLLGERSRRPVGFRACLLRQLLHAVLDVLPLLAGWLWSRRDPKRQTAADKVLGTVVVSVGRHWHRANRAGPPPPPGGSGKGNGCC